MSLIDAQVDAIVALINSKPRSPTWQEIADALHAAMLKHQAANLPALYEVQGGVTNNWLQQVFGP